MTGEQKEIVRELTESDAWEAVIAYCESLTKRQAEAVVNYNLNQGPRGLLILKANLDGAKTLLTGIKNAKRELKIKG